MLTMPVAVPIARCGTPVRARSKPTAQVAEPIAIAVISGMSCHPESWPGISNVTVQVTVRITPAIQPSNGLR